MKYPKSIEIELRPTATCRSLSCRPIVRHQSLPSSAKLCRDSDFPIEERTRKHCNAWQTFHKKILHSVLTSREMSGLMDMPQVTTVSAPGAIGGCPLMGVTSPWRKLKEENVSHIVISCNLVLSIPNPACVVKRFKSRGDPTAVGETQLNMCQNGL